MPPNYRRAFWTSRHHAWLALLTLGLGFASGTGLGLFVGATLYALGLVFVPDLAFFRRAIDARNETANATEAAAQLAAFQKQQESLLANLSTGRRARYTQLVAVCRDIESASAEAQTTAEIGLDTRRKLDELTWTYLRMLNIEQSLEVYLETERREQVPALVKTLEAETPPLAAEVESLRKISPRPATLDGKERLLTSRLERLSSLRLRVTRIEQAQANHDLVRSEQERLVEQVKLIRADAIAAKNADTLTARIDLSIEHLAATNKWLSELAEFKDLTAQMPAVNGPTLSGTAGGALRPDSARATPQSATEK
ncbi:MAG: hypothetical protein NTV51_22440 [Verrucomicrobia bacterium]|nr:hypothetical protein [Verrucomicrobiota bacterium]